MLLLFSILAVSPALDANLRTVPPVCIPEVSECSRGLIQGQGVDGTYCYDDKYNIKEKLERSGKNFKEVMECSPGLQQGKSVLMPFCVDENNTPRQKLINAFEAMDKVTQCSEGLRQGIGAYKKFCFDIENNIVEFIYDDAGDESDDKNVTA